MATLKDVCFQRICSNGTDDFWYGIFGDFNLIINKTDNTFNATKLCTDGGKEFSNWKQNKHSEELVSYILSQKKDGIETIDDIFKLHKGGSGNSRIINGTYVPQNLILTLASWISPEFYIKVNQIISDYYANEYINQYKSDNENLTTKIKQNELKNKKLRARVKRLNGEVQKYRRVYEDITPKTINQNKLHIFALIDKNGDDYFPYYAIRAQRESYGKQLKRLQSKYPKLKVIKHVTYDPNSINLFNRIKEHSECVYTRYNNIGIMDGYKTDDLVNDIDQLSNNKF